MKNRKMNIICTAVSSIMIAVLLASVCLAGCQQEAEAPVGESVHVPENLQNFDFPDFEPMWGTTAFPGEYSKGYDVTIDYAYSDRYFDFDASIYNPSLATMSLCLELSSWSSYEADNWPEKSHNAQKLLEEIGFVDYAQNDFWNEKPSVHSIGVVAGHKKMEDYTLIALPVRGGNYYNEWGDNVDLGLEGYHAGFVEARDNVVAFLETYIEDCNITGRVKLWIVGYSRGGAVANLTAGYLNQNPLPNGAELAFEDLYCYTFEAPQGAMMDAVGEDAAHANIHNIINANDIVPMVGPADWGFTRYNSTSRLLPTVTTAQFESARETMLEEFEEILEGATITNPDATAYRISEYAKTIQVEFDPMNFLPSGEPLLEIKVVDDTRQTMNEMLTVFISGLVESVGGRDKFYDGLQSDLILLLELLKGYESGFDADAVIDMVLETMTQNDYENLKYVLAPAMQMNGASAQERVDQVVDRLHEVLPQPEGFTDLYRTAGTLIRAICTMMVNHPEEVLDVALAFTNSNVMQAHHQELTLAWVRAGDPHYTDTPYTMAVPETLRMVRVNCPVDVYVYDSRGTLVSSAIGGVCTSSNDVVGCAINKDGEVILHLPADEEYRVVTSATDDGEVNITLSEYNVVRSQTTRVRNYPDIPVQTGDVLTLEAPDLAEEEFTDKALEGSTADYRLLDEEEEEIPCQREDRGEDVAFFAVTVGQNSSYGMVSGGGQYLDGSFAQVNAQPMAGGTFGGWYANGVLVSGEESYRFAVEEDVSLVAYFEAPAMYDVHFSVSGEGTVSNADQSYSPGSRVQLSAEAAEGSEFDHWETSSGTIENTTSAQTFLVVEESDASVTAVFRRTACPKCGKTLPEGKSHDAACKVEGHYTCDGTNHNRKNCGHYACTLGNHYAAACGVNGHYACDGDAHGTAACGHSACASGNHSKAACAVHYICDGASHEVAACKTTGHFGCDGVDHTVTQACAHYACIGEDHTDVACGTSGHYTCDGSNHSAGSCGQGGHYNCDTTSDHGTAACGTSGHYACDSGDHTLIIDSGWNNCGHYSCDESVAGLTHAVYAGCGSHFQCDSSAAGLEHTSCEHGCGYSKCSGEVPVPHDGSCYTWANYTCKSCNVVLSDSGEHKYDCGQHYNCDGVAYTAEHSLCPGCGNCLASGGEHTLLACGEDYSCAADTLTGHEACTHCGYCVLNGDHSDLGCGQHFNCVDGGEHGLRSCGIHYACDTASDAETCSRVCSGCSQPMCNGADHTLAGCGMHHANDGGDHSGAECGTAGHYVCSGEHDFYPCGSHRKCDSDGNYILCTTFCDPCYEYWCVQKKIHIESECNIH